MDPITHAASGAVAMLAMPNRPASRWAVPLAALAAASPDVDVLMANTPLQFLLLHRGITHSLFFAPLLGLVLALKVSPHLLLLSARFFLALLLLFFQLAALVQFLSFHADLHAVGHSAREISKPQPCVSHDGPLSLC